MGAWGKDVQFHANQFYWPSMIVLIRFGPQHLCVVPLCLCPPSWHEPSSTSPRSLHPTPSNHTAPTSGWQPAPRAVLGRKERADHSAPFHTLVFEGLEFEVLWPICLHRSPAITTLFSLIFRSFVFLFPLSEEKSTSSSKLPREILISILYF